MSSKFVTPGGVGLEVPTEARRAPAATTAVTPAAAAFKLFEVLPNERLGGIRSV